jgi:hypothetical protein
MEIVQDLVTAGIGYFALAIALAQAIAQRVGFWLGQRRAAAAPKEEVEAAGFIVGALLALLAFTMALTISFAQARFEDRRAASLAEANAIGTAWLRASALGGEQGAAIAADLAAYLALRRDFVTAPADPARVRALNAATAEAQAAIWARMTAIVQQRPDAISASLMAALNETFDTATAQRQAHAARMPRELVLLLLTMTMVSIGVIGYQFGLRGRRHPVLGAILVLTWTAALVVIADLSAPRAGDLRTDPAVYDWTAQGMGVR